MENRTPDPRDLPALSINTAHPAPRRNFWNHHRTDHWTFHPGVRHHPSLRLPQGPQKEQQDIWLCAVVRFDLMLEFLAPKWGSHRGGLPFPGPGGSSGGSPRPRGQACASCISRTGRRVHRRSSGPGPGLGGAERAAGTAGGLLKPQPCCGLRFVLTQRDGNCQL